MSYIPNHPGAYQDEEIVGKRRSKKTSVHWGPRRRRKRCKHPHIIMGIETATGRTVESCHDCGYFKEIKA